MRSFDPGLGFDISRLDAGIGLQDARIALGSGADLRRFAFAYGSAFSGDGFALGAHAVNGGRERDRGQRQALNPHLQHAHTISAEQLLFDLLAQLRFEVGNSDLAGIGIYQA